MLKKLSKVLAISVVASVFITGCSVKPEAISKEDITQDAKNDMDVLNRVVQPVIKPISLDEAIQRGLDHNLQKRVKILETALAQKQLDLVYYDMLPSLTASAGYSERNNDALTSSASRNPSTGELTKSENNYSVSQEKQRTTADLTFSWNILDFGLSYVRAQQQADKFLIAQEKQKKVEHTLNQEIRRAYYEAVSSQDLLKRIQPMMVEVKKALEDSKKMQQERVAKTPMEALSYQRELLDILRSLHTLESSLISAKVELAELMGLKPGIQFELADKVEKDYEIPKIDINLEQMEMIALENRPELAESRYQERISEKEITAAKLRMLPSINLNTSLSYESNDYLLNNDWYSYGANVSWNLLNVFKGSEMNKLAKTQVEVAKEQKLALSMAVLSQVHLSIVKFNQAKKEYELAKDYLNVADNIFDLTKIENEVNVNSRLILIKEKLNNILATLRHSASYANVQNSYGRIFASMGINQTKSFANKVDNSVQTPVKIEDKINSSINMPSQTTVTPVNALATDNKELDKAIYSNNFSNSKIIIYEGEKLNVNGKEHVVKKSEDVSKIATYNGLTIKEVVANNPWLIERNRVEFK